tara:strand:+ start:2354 stop:3109 length:756 start_codon:yes stop_codon:yes gene_type:complete
MRRNILNLISLIAKLWKLIPSKIRIYFFIFLFLLESRDKNTGNGLKKLFKLKDKLEWVINERALFYGNGIHPKHKLTRYHDFFVDRINDGEVVVDIGCGYGAVARSIAKSKVKSKIYGIDIDEEKINQATSYKNPPNLIFLKGNAEKSMNIKADVIVLSNVLEHIFLRNEFLNNIRRSTNAKKFLIRVPMFERDWQIPLRKELKTNFFSDDDHKIEHTIDEFKNELKKSDFEITYISTVWGEIWAECVSVI